MNPLLQVNYDVGNTLTISNSVVVLAKTYLSRDIASSVTTIPVENNNEFTNGVVPILLGDIGGELTEKLDLASTSGNTSLTTGSGTKFTHSRGEPVYQLEYANIEVYKASSLGGSYSLLATIPLNWTELQTVYQHSAGLSTDYYKVRFVNSVSGLATSYSAETGPTVDTTTLGYLISKVRTAVGNISLDDQFFIDAIGDARQILEKEYGYGRVYEWRQNFEYPIQMLAGTNFVSLPTNGSNAIDEAATNRFLLNARYSRQGVALNLPMKYVDKRAWNLLSWQNRYATTSGATLSGATSLVLSSTGDLPASGTVFIATELPTQSILTVTYTSNNLLTNTLGGVSGITRNVASGTQAWGTLASNAYPMNYTVFDNKIYFDRVVPSTLQGKNLYIDYYKRLVPLTNMNDPLPEPYRDIYKDYMRFAIKRRRDDSIGEEDPDYKRFIRGADAVFGNPYTGQSNIIIT